MIVLNRTQVTEITTKRQVSHVLKIDGIEYNRYEEILIRMDYMGIAPYESESKIKWAVVTAPRTSRYLPKKEWKVLEVKFQELKDTDRNAWNGNNRIWEN